MTIRERIWRTRYDLPELGDAPSRAVPGMVLTIRYDTTGQTETFLLGRRFADQDEVPAYSTLSPLGRAITGARLGEKRTYSIPHGPDLRVTLVGARPYRSRG